MTEVFKRLSGNDLGLTGSHQAGLTIPKSEFFLNFFPLLDKAKLNPRARIVAFDTNSGIEYPLSFIYYNGKLTGQSTRNEYRLTGLTAYFREVFARPGDMLRIEKMPNGRFALSIEIATEGFESSAGEAVWASKLGGE